MLTGTMKSTAQIGVTVLEVFGHALKEKYDSLGLAGRIQELRKGL